MSRYKLLTLTLGALLLAAHSYADDANLWNGKRAAVSLTYDDSLNVHLDKALPALDRAGLKGTFYLTVSGAPFAERLDEWRTVAQNGHELGNHTLFHPCEGGKAGRNWVDPARDLSHWSIERMVGNIRVTNTTLEAVDGKKERTLAYPCGDKLASGQSYVEAIMPDFVAARGVTSAFARRDDVALFDIPAFMINGESLEKLTALVDRAIADGTLLVFMFHGVGGEHNLNVDDKVHEQLLAYLTQHNDQLWIAPMVDVARFIKASR